MLPLLPPPSKGGRLLLTYTQIKNGRSDRICTYGFPALQAVPLATRALNEFYSVLLDDEHLLYDEPAVHRSLDVLFRTLCIDYA